MKRFLSHSNTSSTVAIKKRNIHPLKPAVYPLIGHLRSTSEVLQYLTLDSLQMLQNERETNYKHPANTMMNSFWTAQMIIFPQGQKPQNKTINLLRQKIVFLFCVVFCWLYLIPLLQFPISSFQNH